MISRLFLFVAFAMAFLRRSRADTDTSGGSSLILPIGRDAVVKRHVVHRIRILRSKPIADTSNSYGSKGTKSSKEKKMKKQRSSKSMSKSTKASKGDKEDTSTDSSDHNYNNNGGGSNNGGDTDDSENNNSDDNGENNGGEPEAEPEPEPEPTDEPVAEPKPEPTDEPVDDTDGTENNGGSAEFDISDCESYSNDWLVELADYCGPNLEDLSSCECPTAGTLLAKGVLTCASRSEKDSSPPACPNGCPVCEFCMVLEGCEDIYD